MTTKKTDAGETQGANETPADPASAPPGAAAPETPDAFRGFMVALATDPAKLGAFLKDPDATMGEAGIDDVDQVILKSGQSWTIHARLNGQRFSLTPPKPVAMLVVDMVRPPGASAAGEQPVVRSQLGSTSLPQQQGSSTMFPNFPQIHPQVVVHPQIFPQVHPQVVVHPQIFPQVHPQLVIHPQIFPQVHPQVVVHPQIFPQVHPQLVIHPPVFPQFLQFPHPMYPVPYPQFPVPYPQFPVPYPQFPHPLIPQLMIHPTVFPTPQLLVHPQIFPSGG